MMSNLEFEALKEDIKTHGQLEPILYWKEMLVDGRNRLKACEELGIEAREVELTDETDPVDYVISHNLHRRNMSETQRAIVGAKLATFRNGANQHSRREGPEISGPSFTTEEASKLLNVSESSIEKAKRVINEGSATIVKLVELDKIKVSAAEKFIKATPDKKQQEQIAKQGAEAVKEANKSQPKKQQQPKTQVIAVVESLVWEDVPDSEDDSKVLEFKKFWSKCNDLSKRAVWVWLRDNYEGS
jgi:ParB-like chromosome segregation protein Spo0J